MNPGKNTNQRCSTNAYRRVFVCSACLLSCKNKCCVTATYKYKKTKTHILYCQKNQPSYINIHVNSQCRNNVKLHRNGCNNLQNAKYSMIIHGPQRNTTNDMHIQYLYYVHTSGHHSQLLRTLNCTIYLLWEQLRKIPFWYTVILVFFYNVQVQTVHAIKCKAQARKGHKSACYQVSWKPLEGRPAWECEWKLPVSYRSSDTLPPAASCKINSSWREIWSRYELYMQAHMTADANTHAHILEHG